MLWKKGDLEIRYIILLILGLIVLATMVYIFKDQISVFIDTLSKIGGDASSNAPSIKDVVGG